MEYVSDPKDTDFTIVFNESMTMPNITFCMSRQQGMSHFNIDNLTETPEEWDAIVQVGFSRLCSPEISKAFGYYNLKLFELLDNSAKILLLFSI